MTKKSILAATLLCSFSTLAMTEEDVSQRLSMREGDGLADVSSSMPEDSAQTTIVKLLWHEDLGKLGDVQSARESYTALVVKDGKAVEILADPRTGKVNQPH